MVNTDTPSAQCPQIPANDHQISTFYTLSSERNARLSLRNAIELNKTKNQIMRSETLKQIKIIDISLSFLPSIHSFFCHFVWSADMIMTSSGQSVLTSRDWLTPGSSSRHSPPQSDTESPEPPSCPWTHFRSRRVRVDFRCSGELWWWFPGPWAWGQVWGPGASGKAVIAVGDNQCLVSA